MGLSSSRTDAHTRSQTPQDTSKRRDEQNKRALVGAQPLDNLMEEGKMELSGKVELDDTRQRGDFMELLQ